MKCVCVLSLSVILKDDGWSVALKEEWSNLSNISSPLICFITRLTTLPAAESLFLLLFYCFFSLAVHSSFSESVAGCDHCVLCFLQCALFPPSHSLLMAIVLCPLSFLPHPLALSLLFCSLCARSVSWALTSRCDPTEPRWLWYTVQSTW